MNYINLSSSTCFERHPLIFRRSMMLTVHVCSLWYPHSRQVADGHLQRMATYREGGYQRLHTCTVDITDLLKMSG
jgi:hypothetical protein